MANQKRQNAIEAIRSAERIVSADDQIQLRVSSARKQLYVDAARRAGKSLTRWLIDSADAALK